MAQYVRVTDVKLLLKALGQDDSSVDVSMDFLYERAKFSDVDDGSDPHEHYYVAKSMTRTEKINLCYNVAKRIGDEVECCFEDMLSDDFDKAFKYYFKLYWEQQYKEEPEWLL